MDATMKEQEPLQQQPRGASSSSCFLLRGGDDLRALVMRRAERAVAMRVAQLLADGII